MNTNAGIAAALLALLAPGLGLAQSPLPPIPAPSAFERELAEPRIPVGRIVVEGVRSIPEADIRAVVAPFENRALGEGDLREVERRLTRLYVEKGFATSGVVRKEIGPRAIAAGAAPGATIVTFTAVEGTVERVRFIEPPRHASAGWLASLLVPRPAEPIRLDDLQERMTALRDAGVVERINAQLVPLPERGASELAVTVEERRPWELELRYDNHHSPVIGARRPSAWFTHRNPSGWGDRLGAHVGRTDGLEDFHVEYSLPIARSPWRLGARYERSDSLALDPPSFRDLEIASHSRTQRAEVGYAWVAQPSATLASSLAFERRDAESTLLGFPFSFIPGVPDGVTEIDVTRLATELATGSSDSALFARGQWSEGRSRRAIEAVEGAPASRFRSFAVQAQYARRLTEAGAQVVARVDGQYSPDTLLPLEKKAVGGALSVRGYRENVLLRDRAVTATIEGRLPAWRWQDRARLTLAVFFDAAYARDSVARDDGAPRSITSVGVGVLAALPWGFSLRLDVARPNRRWLTPNADWQDRGVHFQVSWSSSGV